MALIVPWGDALWVEQLRHLGFGHGSSGPLQLTAPGGLWPKHLWCISNVADMHFGDDSGFCPSKEQWRLLAGSMWNMNDSAESPPSSYQFFVLKWPERPVEYCTSGISKQILLVGSQYSWHCGKTCSKSIGGIFSSSLWVKGHIFIMRRCCFVGHEPLSGQPPSDPQWEIMGPTEPQDSAPFFQCTAKEVGAWRGWQGAVHGWEGWAPSTACSGSRQAEVRARLWGCPAEASGGSHAEELAAGVAVELVFSISSSWWMDLWSPHQTRMCFSLV